MKEEEKKCKEKRGRRGVIRRGDRGVMERGFVLGFFGGF